MLNVFGKFLKELEIYPKVDKDKEHLPLSVLSNEDDNDFNFLAPISLNKVDAKVTKDSYDGAIAEAFEIWILLQKLADGLPLAGKDLQKSSFTPDQFKVVEFLKDKIGKIEVF